MKHTRLTFAAFVVLTVVFTNLLNNYLANPLMLILLVVPVLALILLRRQIGKADWWYAWGLSAAMITGLTLFGVVGLYPALQRWRQGQRLHCPFQP